MSNPIVFRYAAPTLWRPGEPACVDALAWSPAAVALRDAAARCQETTVPDPDALAALREAVDGYVSALRQSDCLPHRALAFTREAAGPLPRPVAEQLDVRVLEAFYAD